MVLAPYDLTQVLSDGHSIAGLSFDPETAGAIMHKQVRRLIDEQGPRAFEMPKSAAVAHETGHVVVGRYHDFAALSCEVTRHAIPREILQYVNGRSAWGGLTQWAQPHPFGAEGPVEFTTVSTATVLAQIAITIAGVIAEGVFDRANYHDGSSIDEVIVAQLLVNQLAMRLGLQGPDLWDLCWHRTAAVLKHNERIARGVMRKLDAAGKLRSRQLCKLIADVRKLDNDPFDRLTAHEVAA